jgi:acyl-CoA synthetase (AMP-forming)/AMP-acid ligase II
MNGGPIWRSEYPEVRVSPALVDEEILAALDARSSAVMLVDAATGQTLTGDQLADRIRRTAAGLRARGARNGDVLAIVAANSAEFAVALYGGLAAGMAITPAHPMLTPGELIRQFGRTRPRFVVADAMAMPAVSTALTEHEPEVEAVFELGDLPLGNPAPESPPTGRTPDDVALLFNSGGTSGLPKTVVHTHGSTTAFLQLLAAVPSFRVDAADRVGLVVPIAHLFGTATLTHSLRSGARVATAAPAPGDVEAFVRLLADNAATVTSVAPPLLFALARHPVVEGYDLSALRLIIGGAAPLSPAVAEEAEERLGCVVADSLGATESWCHSPAADPPVRGSVGRLLPNNEAVIVDVDTGMRLPAGEAGELWVRGPQIMHGYLGGDTAEGIDADGWLHTGDLCRFDAAGNLYVVDRLKEMIKVGGGTVAPAEVESELLDHPAVADVAVVGRPDAEFGEVPVAYVVPAYDVDPAELLVRIAERLAPWKRVRDIVMVEQIPRSPVGKILRRVLRDRERAAASGGVSAGELVP